MNSWPGDEHMKPFLATEDPEVIEKYADSITDLLGPNGEHWYKGAPYDPANTDNMCIMAAQNRAYAMLSSGAINLYALMMRFQDAGMRLVQEMFPDRIDTMRVGDEDDENGHPLAQLNDHPDTTWSDIYAVHEKIKMHVLEKLADDD